MKTPVLAALAACVLASAPRAQEGKPAAQRMEIDVERRSAKGWSVVDAKTVFDQGDRIRFRFRSTFGGYLYVMNYGTSGDHALLFPRQETGEDNRVVPGKDYIVPATQGAFRISGPAGHDIVYWLVSPLKLEGSAAGQFATPPRPVTLLPRCDDTILRARGVCIDHQAGPAPGKDLRSRDLLFIEKDKRTVVASPAPLEGPVVYEFRIAHR